MTRDTYDQPTPTPHGYNAEDLTAYALNELDPDSDAHRAIAAALANDPAIRAEIDAIKLSAAAVHEALADEPAPVPMSRDREGADQLARLTQHQGPLPHGRGSSGSGSRRPTAPLFARPALLAAGFALAAGAAVTVVSMLQPDAGHTPIADHAPAPRGIDAIHAALQTPVTASFQDAPLRAVFAEVTRTTHAELAVDWDALAERGVSPETRITFDADAMPARDLLSLALAAAWQQLPHPDPVVWSVAPDAVHIEARSSLVLRSLAQAQNALAAANPTDNRLTPSQATLAAHPAWQHPGEATEVMRRQQVAAWEAEIRRRALETEIQQFDNEGDRAAAVSERIQTARELQRNRDYPGAIYELEVASRIAPDNENITMLRGLLQDEVVGLEAVHLGRQLDVMRSNQQLVQSTDRLPAMDLYAAPQGATSLYYAQGQANNKDWSYPQDNFSVNGRWAGDVTLGNRFDDGASHNRPASQLDLGIVGGVAGGGGRPGLRSPAAAVPPASPASDRRLERGESVVVEDLVAGAARDETSFSFSIELGLKAAELEELQQNLFELQRPAIDPHQLNRDTYALVNDNPFHTGLNDPLSTFSVDVDTAAYTLVRRQVQQQRSAPVPGAVRIEELINYFDYRYTAPVVEPEMLDNGVVTQASIQRLAADDDTFAPFATHVEVTGCPWAEGHQLVRIGIKGMEVAQEDRPAAHLTFLLDVSGSMNSDNKLPLVKESLRLLLTQLNPDDHVSIVVYAGAAGLVLENASAGDPAAIEDALSKLAAGGSTAGGAGIELAYNIAQQHYVPGGVNRVILCTDGDFNVGISDRDQLVDLIKQRANPEPDADGNTRGVYLSVLGYGMGNLNDNMMEPLTNAGNGNYAYIDSAEEAQKVMVEQVGGTLVAIAKDVKVQVEFNPANVLAYRLIGYENRILAAEDFANDTVDAGDIGAGHTVTALYEVVPFPDDGLGDEETLRQVKLQLEALDEALAFSVSVLQNTPLTDEQYRKLAGSVRLMQQQRDVAAAVQSRAKRMPAAITAAGGIEMRYRDDAGFIDGLDALDELMVVNLRYKPVDAPAEQGTSRLIQTSVGLQAVPFNDASEDTRFAAAVAGFGMVLRNSPHRGDASMQWVIDTAGSALTHDPHGYRAGFVSLAEQAATLLPADAENDRNVLKPVDGREPIRQR